MKTVGITSDGAMLSVAVHDLVVSMVRRSPRLTVTDLENLAQVFRRGTLNVAALKRGKQSDPVVKL